ncbi:Prickle planar cell polarity protein 3 [Geodia barretti]|uniref:Prickle planar cell polarity protein 3 n=2 Tax=Geodia barretti TaxID=519541 RepID=A0AA35XL47_GEOBA|nr:Prickle planar cell polarity protein 3 [Geodia barretti]
MAAVYLTRQEKEEKKKFSLERRKKLQSIRVVAIKKGVLIHEVDEGSACLNCGDACPGFSLHFWRKVCKDCLCPREDHDIREDAGGLPGRVSVGKILFSPDVETTTRRSGDAPGSPKRPLSGRSASGESPSILRKLHNYIWTPKGCSVEEAEAYFKGLPAAKAPVRGTPGEKYHQKQLIRQLPAHDVDLMYCNELSQEEAKQMELFARMRKEKCVGRGEVRTKNDGTTWKCEKCTEEIKIGEVVVMSGRVGPRSVWHPACFTCNDCNELLVDLIYFYHEGDGKVYCGRHHAQKIKPRCAACDELIVCREYTRAEDQDWHLDHFCCLYCDQGLGGKQYRPQNGQPYCLECFEVAFSSICETCGNQVTLDQPRLKHEDLIWHGTDECFVCAFCSLSLLGQPYLPRHGKVFCSKDHAKQFKSKSKKNKA